MGNAYLLFRKKTSWIPPVVGNVFGVRIDESNPSPENAVTYIGDSTDFTPAKMNFSTDTFNYGSWEDKFPFNQIKPCMLNLDGTVNYYLNPNDYSKKLDGSNADITSGADGNVMIEFPKIYWKFVKTGSFIDITFSDEKMDESYRCLAHTKGTEELDVVYISAYLGSEVDSKLRSLSGKSKPVSKTIAQFRTLSKANGEKYDMIAYYQILMLQVLGLVMFKNRSIALALGNGYNGTTNPTPSVSGTLNTKGLFYGDNLSQKQVKFCGIEDFYGHYYWIDGIFCDASRNILIGTENFNNTGSGYINHSDGVNFGFNVGGFISEIRGGTESGFIARNIGGTLSDNYSSRTTLNASRLAGFGGFTSGQPPGLFNLVLDLAATSTPNNRTGRIMSR